MHHYYTSRVARAAKWSPSFGLSQGCWDHRPHPVWLGLWRIVTVGSGVWWVMTIAELVPTSKSNFLNVLWSQATGLVHEGICFAHFTVANVSSVLWLIRTWHFSAMLFCFDNVTFFPFLLFLLFFVFLFFFVLFLKTIPIGVQQSTWREFLVYGLFTLWRKGIVIRTFLDDNQGCTAKILTREDWANRPPCFLFGITCNWIKNVCFSSFLCLFFCLPLSFFLIFFGFFVLLVLLASRGIRI